MTNASYIVQNISKTVWKLPADSNIYLLLLNKNVVIDTGSRKNRVLVEQFLSKVVPLDKIEAVIFTHLHYDHIGNFDLFPNAKFYASKEEIEDFRKRPSAAVLDADMAQLFSVELIPAEQLSISGLEVIPTPGHTRGSICIWYPAEKILFSGDSLLMKSIGRADFPTSDMAAMQPSINRLVGYNFKTLCPGHDY